MTFEERKERFELAQKSSSITQHATQRLGMKKPEVCEKCGKKFPSYKIHAHHPNYKEPLLIEWLCFKCHAGVHSFLRWMERNYQWLVFCKEAGLDPNDGLLPYLGKNKRPTKLTIAQHWMMDSG